jgi:uncharacterized membrane protein
VAGFLATGFGLAIIKYLNSLENRLERLEVEFKKAYSVSKSAIKSDLDSSVADYLFIEKPKEEFPLDKETEDQGVCNEILLDNFEQPRLNRKRAVSQARRAHLESKVCTLESSDTPTTPEWLAVDYHSKLFEYIKKQIPKIKSTLFALNPIAAIGVVILFIGVAFLLKYASTYIHFSIELRLLAVAMAGIVGSFFAWRLYQKRPVFANILQGCSIGLLFLTTYAAFKVYGLLPPMIAFFLLLGIVVYSCMLSVVHNAKSLAVLGVLGGFFSPLLISTGEGNFVLLFSYYTVLNLGILGLAWFKSWSTLNLVGFIFTFILSSLWGWQSYQPEYFYIVEFFLMLFFLFYVVIAILYASNMAKQSSRYVDAIITVGTPFITLSLQAGLVARWTYGLAWSSLAFGVFYSILALIIYRVRYPVLKRLFEVYAALALTFATAAIPLASTGSWASVSWALEGIVLMYVGIKEERMRLRFSACALEVGSGILFLMHYGPAKYIGLSVVRPYFDVIYLTAGVIGLASLICSCMWSKIDKKCNELECSAMQLLFIWGLLWWYVNGVLDIQQHSLVDQTMMACTLFFAASSALFWTVSELFRWAWLRYPALALLPMMFVLEVYSLINYLQYDNTLTEVWALSFVTLYGMLYRHEKIVAPYLSTLHNVSLLLLTCVISDSVSKALNLLGDWPSTWHYLVWGAIPSLVLFLINLQKIPYLSRFKGTCGGTLTAFIMGWIVLSYSLSGNVSPLPYIPLLNPLELLEVFALFVALSWALDNNELLSKSLDITRQAVYILFSALTFLFLNTLIVRVAHHWLSIPYTANDLWSAPAVQTSLSIFWMLLALTTTFIAARKHSRQLWFSGFALIGVVIVKLFLVDLANIGSLERILTFITVGILMLINGYISPMPPKEEQAKESL